MDPRLVDMYRKVKATYIDAVSLLSDIAKESLSEVSAENHADNALALNECNKLLEDLGKETRKVLRLSEKIANMICLKNGSVGPIRTKHVTASLRQKMAASVPPRDSAEYAALCEYIGVPVNDAMRIHYPTLVNMITEAIEQGRHMPAGCGELHPEFHLTLRKQKEVDAGEFGYVLERENV